MQKKAFYKIQHLCIGRTLKKRLRREVYAMTTKISYSAMKTESLSSCFLYLPFP